MLVYTLHLLLQEAQEKTKAEKRKYSVKPPRDLRSKFILKMEARKKKEEEDAEAKRVAEEEEEIAVCLVVYYDQLFLKQTS